jgi:hypothetical protein
MRSKFVGRCCAWLGVEVTAILGLDFREAWRRGGALSDEVTAILGRIRGREGRSIGREVAGRLLAFLSCFIVLLPFCSFDF